MAETIVPIADGELVAFLNNLRLKLPQYVNVLTGITQADADSVSADYETFAYTVAQVETFRTAAQERVAYKDLIKKGADGAPSGTPPTPPAPAPAPQTLAPQGVQSRARALVQRIKTARGYTEAVGVDLGIVAPVTPTPDPVKPTIKAKPLPGGQVEIVYSKGKADGALIEGQRLGEAAWSRIDKALRSIYTDRRTLAEPGRPELRSYRARLLSGDDPTGDYSDVVTVTATP